MVITSQRGNIIVTFKTKDIISLERTYTGYEWLYSVHLTNNITYDIDKKTYEKAYQEWITEV